MSDIALTHLCAAVASEDRDAIVTWAEEISQCTDKRRFERGLPRIEAHTNLLIEIRSLISAGIMQLTDEEGLAFKGCLPAIDDARRKLDAACAAVENMRKI